MFRENRCNEGHFYFGHFYPHCPHLLCDFGEIQYNRSAHNAVESLWVS